MACENCELTDPWQECEAPRYEQRFDAVVIEEMYQLCCKRVRKRLSRKDWLRLAQDVAADFRRVESCNQR